MHAGTIEARSEGLDKGSEFVVILPTPAYDDNHHTGEGLPTRQHVSAIPRHRILVVDDLPEVAESFATLLDVAGQDVLTAHDGRSAIASVLADRPEVVFLDIAMPGMDGYAVARHLRAQPELKVMLVALTGYGQGEDYRQAMEAGFDHHLTKPTSLEKVRELLLSVPVESKP
jgi:CheY-like chemotaxis protein